MRKNLSAIILLSWIFCAAAPFVAAEDDFGEDAGPIFWGEVQTPEGLRFTIFNVRIADWMRAASPAPVKMTAITYGLKNETTNKKIDLTGEFTYVLTDEFGNTYQRLEKPVNYQHAEEIRNKNFPSLYPGEQYTLTVFFEAPVESTQVLNLSIDAQDVGVAQHVSYHLPVVRALPAAPVKKLELSDADLTVSLPPKLRKVKPGEAIPIKVSVADKIPSPDSIYIIAPFHIYEDPDALGYYDLRVPQSHPDGPLTVIVMAIWRQNGQESTLSKSFNLIVKRPKKPCSRNCPEAAGTDKVNSDATP